MGLLTLRDLQFRALRFGLVIVGTTVVFALLLLMTGLAAHFHNESTHAVAVIGADAWLVPDGASGPFTSNATLDPRLARHVEGAERADPIVAARATLTLQGDTQQVVVIGHGRDAVGAPTITQGRDARRSGEVVIDASTGLRTGDQARIGSRSYRVVGVTERATVFAGIPIAFMRIDDARAEVFRGRAVATAIVTRGVPASAPAGLTVLSTDEVAVDTRKPLAHAMDSIDLVRTLLWVVSAMIIGGMVYLSSMERRRDFAVLKAVGASTAGLLGGLAAQGAIIALIASLLAAGAQALLKPIFPLTVEVSASTLIQLPFVAIIVALAASGAGMRRVVRTDPALAFSGPGS